MSILEQQKPEAWAGRAPLRSSELGTGTSGNQLHAHPRALKPELRPKGIQRALPVAEVNG